MEHSIDAAFSLSLLINYMCSLEEGSILLKLVEASVSRLCCVTMWKVCWIPKARFMEADTLLMQ